MATSKTQQAVQAVTPPPLAVMPKELVSACPDTGARVVHFNQKFYKCVDAGVESCGTTATGEPDNSWASVADADIPPKARSMLGLQ